MTHFDQMWLKIVRGLGVGLFTQFTKPNTRARSKSVCMQAGRQQHKTYLYTRQTIIVILSLTTLEGHKKCTFYRLLDLKFAREIPSALSTKFCHVTKPLQRNIMHKQEKK